MHGLSVWLKTGSNPADIHPYRRVNGVIASKNYLNALMQCRVIPQVTIRRESHLTVGTFIWFVSAVDSLVHNQLPAASKTFTT